MASDELFSERRLPKTLDLTGRRALVTGGSRGIGRAIALALASRGASVAVSYAQNGDAARGVCAEIEALGGRAFATGFDVGDAAQVEDALKRVVEALGGLDILVNNAGVSIDALLMRVQEDDWDRLERTNLRGALLCSRAAARVLLKAKARGRIVNISSVVGERGNAGQAMYAATKAGLIGMTKSLAREFAPRGVTVNVVSPGYIETDMTSEALKDAARASLLQQIPLARVGTPDEIAEAVAFLASDAAAYITGHVLRVNGGLHI